MQKLDLRKNRFHSLGFVAIGNGLAMRFQSRTHQIFVKSQSGCMPSSNCTETSHEPYHNRRIRWTRKCGQWSPRKLHATDASLSTVSRLSLQMRHSVFTDCDLDCIDSGIVDSSKATVLQYWCKIQRVSGLQISQTYTDMGSLSVPSADTTRQLKLIIDIMTIWIQFVMSANCRKLSQSMAISHPAAYTCIGNSAAITRSRNLALVNDVS